MNMGVGITLVVAMFPDQHLVRMCESGEAAKIHRARRTGNFPDGTPFVVVAPKDIPMRVEGMAFRKVVMNRGTALTHEQIAFLGSRHRFNIGHDLIEYR